jgi:hypothetical protein
MIDAMSAMLPKSAHVMDTMQYTAHKLLQPASNHQGHTVTGMRPGASFLCSLLALIACIFLPQTAHGKLDSSGEFYTWVDNRFIVPLEIKDNSGVDRTDWPVTSGVPLPPGLVADPGELRLTDSLGNELPCQFTVLSRYWATDNSIRWILLDFQVNTPADGATVVQLRNDAPHQAVTDPIRLAEESQTVTVDTGPLAATISRTAASLLEAVVVNGKPILQASPFDGPVIRSKHVNAVEHFKGNSWNTHEWEHTSVIKDVDIQENAYIGDIQSTSEVTIESAGPMHAVVLLRGRYSPLIPDASGHKEDFLEFTTRLHFFRGHSFIKVEHSLENSSRAQPQWMLPFQEASLLHTLSLGPDITVTGGGVDEEFNITTARSQTSHKGESWLYQTPGSPGRPPQAGGYQLLSVNGSSGQQNIGSGAHARFLDASDGDKGVAVSFAYFSSEAPRAISFRENTLQLFLHAGPFDTGTATLSDNTVYDLDFGQRSIHDLLYYFHDGSAQDANAAEIAEAFQYPLFARAPPAWYADTETWYFEIGRQASDPPKIFRNQRHWDNKQVGWELPPYRPNYNSGGHHDNLNSVWLEYLRSGSSHVLEKSLWSSRAAISLNPGWVYRDNILSFGKGSDKYSDLDKALLDWDRTAGFGPKEFYLWRSADSPDSPAVPPQSGTGESGGTTYLNDYKRLPDHEHYAYFELFEYYYLTGDRRATDAIHGFVNWDLNFQHKYLFKRNLAPLSATNLFSDDPDALRRGHPFSRIYSWMLYTNLAGFNATGSPVMDEFTRWQIRRILALLRHRHGQLSSWTPKPGTLLNFLPKDWQDKIARHVDIELLRAQEEIITTHAKTWMEAQGVLALHEAYKTYQDERILDAIWGLADYFSNHVVFFPNLGMVNNITFMPNARLGGIAGDQATLTPRRHDRIVQVWPILHHYTGWPGITERYEITEDLRKNTNVKDWFLQTGLWERETAEKPSTQPAEPIRDLQVDGINRNSIEFSWTSPKDDSRSGNAARYFLKYSQHPITEFAPSDNPQRRKEKDRVINDTESLFIKTPNSSPPRQKALNVPRDRVTPESPIYPLEHPDWAKVDAFWMAEHVTGEPEPGPAGTREYFSLKTLAPHNWFGAATQPGIDTLKPGVYYFAICSWDEDKNLSRLSNVVRVDIP